MNAFDFCSGRIFWRLRFLQCHENSFISYTNWVFQIFSILWQLVYLKVHCPFKTFKYQDIRYSLRRLLRTHVAKTTEDWYCLVQLELSLSLRCFKIKREARIKLCFEYLKINDFSQFTGTRKINGFDLRKSAGTDNSDNDTEIRLFKTL